jgi:pSer/pThr/pTyr-binding forkhead associated (FHA) protein
VGQPEAFNEIATPGQPEPSASTLAKLIVIRPDGSEGTTLELSAETLVIGRESEHHTLSTDPFLSPEHASIAYDNGRFTLQDLDSLNGVFYRIRGEVEIYHNDYLRLGQELLHFELMSEVPTPPGSGDDTLHAGSPDTGNWARLSLVAGPDVVTRSFGLSDDEINIGREIGSILFRDDGFVSGKHARISRAEGRVVIRDLGSSNGTYIRIKDNYPLEDGDLILMGQQLFRMVTL